MRKLFAILCLIVLSVLTVMIAGEKRIVGARVNNQVMLLRVDLANYQMDCSTDGTVWSAVSGTSGSGDVTGPSSSVNNNLAAFDGTTGKIIKDSGVAVSGFATSGANSNITSMTGLTTALSVTQGGTGATSATNARTSLSAASSGANSDITSLTGLTTALSIAQGGTGLSALGTAGQVLAVNSGATALEFATMSATSTWDAITGKPIDLTDYDSSYDGHAVKFRYASTGDIDTNCKLMLHFDNNVTDSSENAVTVTAYNSPTYSAGVFNQAITFNGSDQYLSFPAPFTSIPANGFTVEFRFKASSAPGTQRMIWFSQEDPCQGGLLLNTNGTVSAWFYDGNTVKEVTSISSVCDDNWHTIAVSTLKTSMRLLVNGVSQGSVAFFENFSFASTWYIARRDPTSSLYCPCSIDELRVSDVARYTTAYTPKASAFSSEVSKSLYVDSSAPDTILINTQTESYTFVLGDKSKLVTMSNASANTLTIPLNSSVAYPVGTWIDVGNIGAGACTITASGGVTLNGTDGGTKDLAQWAGTRLYKIAENAWITR